MHIFCSRTYIFLLFLLPLFVHAQYTDVINSNRPSRSMGAFSVGTNVYQWEQGISMRHGAFSSFQNAKFSGIGTRAQLRIGLFKEQLEFIGSMDYQEDTFEYINSLGSLKTIRKGFKEATFGAKYLVFDPFRNVDKYKPSIKSWRSNNRFRWQDLVPAISVYAAAQFNLDNKYPLRETFAPLFRWNYRPIITPAVTGTALMLIQQHIRPGWVLVHNVGIQDITSKFTALKIIGTLTYSHRDRWSFYGEYQLDDSVLYRDLTFGAGAAYLLNRNMQLDVAVQTNRKETPHLFSAGIGLSYRIDQHNIFADEPQSIAELKKVKSERSRTKVDAKFTRKAERRTNKELRKLAIKQKRIERKINRKQ